MMHGQRNIKLSLSTFQRVLLSSSSG